MTKMKRKEHADIVTGDIMDIGSGKGYPAASLSNFSPHPFTLDGVECNSMEGFLQSLKFDNQAIEEEVCKLVGKAAKFRGKKRNKTWKSKQTLWWRGTAYKRDSDEYQRLLDRAFLALSENDKFAKALLATGDANLTHSIGKRKKQDTVLTSAEFCSRLLMIRKALQEELEEENG